MAAQELGSQDDVIAFLVAAGIMYEIVAAACSSPQTAEINAHKRAKTLMKWVYLGLLQGAFFILIAASIDKKRRRPTLLGGGLAGGLLAVQYVYAKNCGLKSGGSGTED